MEFNVLNGRFVRREIKDSKQFIIVTEDRNVMTIPNFLETKDKYVNELLKNKLNCHCIYCSDIRIRYAWEIIPFFYFHNSHLETHCCDILTGEWKIFETDLNTFYDYEISKINQIDRRVKLKELLSDVIGPKELRSIVCEYS